MPEWKNILAELRNEGLTGDGHIIECEIYVMFQSPNVPIPQSIKLDYPKGRHYRDAVRSVAAGIKEDPDGRI